LKATNNSIWQEKTSFNIPGGSIYVLGPTYLSIGISTSTLKAVDRPYLRLIRRIYLRMGSTEIGSRLAADVADLIKKTAFY
jgi:hypothetical protein